ncbi:MAG: DUF6512 family protein [Bacilli bacterium]|nr:DUF6512 family protein [Bacilli bacterium]
MNLNINLKIWKIISVVGIFILSFLFHQLYDWFPNKLFSIFFPVNESIWEHLKMIFTTITFWLFVEYNLFYCLFKDISYNNLILSSLVSSLSTIIIFLIIYSPIYNLVGHNLILTLIIYFIAISLGQLISYYILVLNINLNKLNIISVILIIIIFTLFGYFTYNPLKCPLFYDEYGDKYGIYNYYNKKN